MDIGKNYRMDISTPLAGLVAMSEGNPGCASVLGQIAQKGEVIDPQMAFEGLGHIMMLDTYNIYGSNVWVFYKDMCGQNIVRIIGAIRATQMGIKPIAWVKDLIEIIQDPNAGGYCLDNIREWRKELDEALIQVREKLPEFQKEDGEILFPLPGEGYRKEG